MLPASHRFQPGDILLWQYSDREDDYYLIVREYASHLYRNQRIFHAMHLRDYVEIKIEYSDIWYYMQNTGSKLIRDGAEVIREPRLPRVLK